MNDDQSAEAHLKVRAASHIATLRTQGIPGIPQGDTTTFTSDDGKWKITVPTEHYRDFGPGMFAFVSISVVQPFIENETPTPGLKGLILPRAN